MDGLRSKDAQKVVQTYHPAYRPCISPANKSFIDRDVASQMGSHIDELEPAAGH